MTIGMCHTKLFRQSVRLETTPNPDPDIASPLERLTPYARTLRDYTDMLSRSMTMMALWPSSTRVHSSPLPNSPTLLSLFPPFAYSAVHAEPT
jgi:hypothetical protein